MIQVFSRDGDKTSRPCMGPTQPPVKLVPVFFPGGKSIGEWSSPLTFIYCRG